MTELSYFDNWLNRSFHLYHIDSKDTRPHEKVQETTEESTSTSDKDRQQNEQFRVIPERETWHQVPPHGRHFKHKAAGGKKGSLLKMLRTR